MVVSHEHLRHGIDDLLALHAPEDATDISILRWHVDVSRYRQGDVPDGALALVVIGTAVARGTKPTK